jgi:hypothetical protein
MTQNEKTVVVASQATESEKALKVIQDLVSKAKDLKLVEQEAKTGFSYFAGKKRLCKLLKTKRGVTLEINVKLPKELKDLAGLENISTAMAHKKHLGTMKHLFRSPDSKEIKKIMVEALKVFKAENQEEKKEEVQEPQVKEAK